MLHASLLVAVDGRADNVARGDEGDAVGDDARCRHENEDAGLVGAAEGEAIAKARHVCEHEGWDFAEVGC